MADSSEVLHDRFLQTRYFGALDGLRAISILSVIFYHVPELRPLWRTGYLGVHLFFVISGFLITTLLLREKDRNGRISLKDFYVRRTLRIFPAYYLTLLLFLVTCYALPDLRREALPTYLHNLPSFLTYTSNWFVNPWGSARVVFVAAWSLATEEQFYLFWPWVIAFNKDRWTPVIIMLGLIAISQIIKIKAGYLFFLTGYSFPIIIFNSVSTAICLGCLLAFAMHSKRSFEMLWKLLGQRWSAPVFLGLMLVIACVPNDDILLVGHMLVVVIAMTLTVGACCIREDNVLRPLLTNAPVRYIGMVSYGMYLYHAFGLNIGERYFRSTQHWPALYFAIIVGITLIMASASYWLFERRFLEWKKRFSARRLSPIVATPTPAIPQEVPLA